MNNLIAEKLRRFPAEPAADFDVKDMWIGAFKAYCSHKLRLVDKITDHKITDEEKSIIMKSCSESSF